MGRVMRIPKPTSLFFLTCALSCFAALGCGADEEGSRAAPGPLKAEARIGLRRDVAHMSGAEWDALVVPHDGPGLWLAPRARDGELLRPGAVTVIEGRGVLKAGAVTDEGDHLVVENLPADLGEFIQDGTIAIGGVVSFDRPFEEDDALEVREAESSSGAAAAATQGEVKTQSLRPLGDPLKEETSYDKPGKTLHSTAKKVLTDGWTMDKHVSGTGDALRYEITMTKDSGGLLARLHLVGKVNNLATSFEAAVHDRITQRHTYDVATSGEADLTWEIGITDGSVGYHKVLIPGVAYRQPFFLGEVPMLLKVKSGFVLVVAASGRNTTTTGRVHVTWSNDGGVRMTPGEGASDASGQGDVSFEEHKGGLAVGPSAFGLVATLPRVEIGVGLDKLFVAGSYFSNTSTTLVESRGGLAGDPCAQVSTKLEGKVGLFLDAGLGGSLILRSVELTESKLSKKLYEMERSAVTCGIR